MLTVDTYGRITAASSATISGVAPAGSASGVLPNPVGYNRIYVHLDGPFSHELHGELDHAGDAALLLTGVD